MSSAKHTHIAAALREQIARGRLRPSDRLPTRDELVRRFGASRMTVQRAINQLTREGLLTARTREGTFVTDRPPMLSRVGLVFPRRPARHLPWPRFWVALQQAALARRDAGGYQITPYYSGGAQPDSEDFVQLRRDVDQGRLAGLIFATQPEELLDTDLLERPNLPRAAVMAAPLLKGVPTVFPDVCAFVDRALDELMSLGRRRIALLTPGHHEPHVRHIRAVFARRELTLREPWLQTVNPGPPDAARGVTLLLMDGPAGRRPDGLIVTDDNLVESCAAGLIAAAVRVPRDLTVVAHCNFPLPVSTALALRRLGFDCHDLIERCVAVIDAQRMGKPTPRHATVPPLFDDELVSVASPVAVFRSRGRVMTPVPV